MSASTDEEVTRTDDGEGRGARPIGRPWVIQVVAWVLVVAGGAWLVFTEDESPAAESSQEGVIQQYPPGDRQAVDGFTGTLLDGDRFNSADAAGRVTVYNVWGSWCVPCRTEAPELIEVAKKYQGRVGFVGVNVRDSVAAAQAFERRLKVPYPSLRSESSDEAFLAFGGALTAAAVPTTVVVDAEGLVAARVVGPTTASTLIGLVDDVMADGTSPDESAQSPNSR